MNSTKAATNVAWLGLACLGLLACSPEDAEQGALGPAGRSANDRVAAQFPEQVLVLQQRGEGLEQSADGRFFSSPRLDPSLSLYLDVPVDRKEPVVVSRASGFALRVWDNDPRGEAVLVDGQVSYGRAKGGTSFWVTAKNRAEEWLYYPEGLRGVEAASYRLEGGEPRQHGTTIDVYDAAGKAQLTMSAPQVFAATGDHVDARMVLEGDVARVILEHAVEGPLLVDPVFVPAGDLNVDRMWHRAVLLNSGRVLVAGGYRQPNGAIVPTATNELFDPATATFSMAATTLIPRYEHTATMLEDGRVLVVGDGAATMLPYFGEVYDETTNTWTATGPQNDDRTGHVATRLADGTVLLACGASSPPSAEIYDPVSNTMSAVASPPQGRVGGFLFATPAGDAVLGGGIAASPLETEIYHKPGNQWTAGSPRIYGYSNADPLALPSAESLILGGLPGGNGVEVFDEATSAWAALPSTIEGRTFSAAILTADGDILVTGGDGVSPNDFIMLATTEKLASSMMAWSSGPSMAVGRVAHTATLLNDGRALVVGGYNGSSLQSAELLTIDGALGSVCTQASQCQSLRCVDGVCCDGPCDGTCETCVAAQGAVADGICGASTGESCDDTLSCTTTDTCNGGACVGFSKECPPSGDPCWTAACHEEFGGQCLSAWAPEGSVCPGGTCDKGNCVPGATGAGGFGGSSRGESGSGGTSEASSGDSSATGAPGSAQSTSSGGTGGAAEDGRELAGGGCSLPVGDQRDTPSSLAATAIIALLLNRRRSPT